MKPRKATPEKIAEAVRQLRAEGLEPTQARVSAKVGGSYSTIGPILSSILEQERASSREARPTGPPPEVMEIAKKAVESIYLTAERVATARIEEVEADCRAQVEELKRAKAEADLMASSFESKAEDLAASLELAKQAAHEAREKLALAEGIARANAAEINRASREVELLRKEVQELRDKEREARDEAAELRGRFKGMSGPPNR